MTGAPALKLDRVSKAFGARIVVRDVSLALGHGEILSLVGASGCGKSTLLRLIAGLETPTAGAIAIGDEAMSDGGIFVEPEKRGVGFIFQDYALFPHLTVAQNVRYGLRGVPSPKAAAIASEMLERVGLAAFGDRHPHQLSGGEQQRVALARALAPKPHLLLLDEPFSNLDRRLGDRVRARTLALLREFDAAAILVTHDPEEAMASGDRVALMREGAIVQIGPAEELYDRPTSREAADFFTAASALPGTRVNGHVVTPLGRFPAPPDLAEGESAAVYIRARSVRLVGAGDGVAARLVTRSFIGHGYELLLKVEGVEEPLRAHVGAAEGAQVGDLVHVRVNPDDGLIFAGPRSDER